MNHIFSSWLLPAGTMVCSLPFFFVACGGGSGGTASAPVVPAAVANVALIGDTIDRGTFANPHAHIPAQCYIETSHGAQNACLFCHTDGVSDLKLGNNNPMAGGNPNVGNLQASYAFGVLRYPYVVNSSIMPWVNTLQPGILRAAVEAAGHKPGTWDMQSYIRQDNWRAAFAQRPGSVKDWDTKVNSPWRLFPALSPDDLPAKTDGFLRSTVEQRGYFNDGLGWNTGWRSVNFMPYGIFTPLAGSVSGIYIRLPDTFMKNSAGEFDLGAYKANLDRVERNIQDRLTGETRYSGAASSVQIVRGQYPIGTEFAHPLHYVDVAADGQNSSVSSYPGSRARRVKEIRWMVKSQDWYPDEFGMSLKDEGAPVYASRDQGWIENGVGWILGGWIENANGDLRPQTPSELTQCVGCHSGNVRQSDVGQHATYTSGVGNTIDSTWAMGRKFAGDAGWQEMNYLGYRANLQAGEAATPGDLTVAEPVNRQLNRGEFRVFLDYVVGASLYGDMPDTVEGYLASQITRARGYEADWPELKSAVAQHDAAGIKAVQAQRLSLMRAFTARGAHLNEAGTIRPELFLPTRLNALAGASRYRQVVVTQRYDYGKDVFPETPFTLRYFRTADVTYTHQDGSAYKLGEVITDRPINNTVGDFAYGMGTEPTLIDEALPFLQGGTFLRNYVPLLKP
ncbi:MAG: hypothetical protein KBD82_09855 [Rhodoferax sp.]|jgi:hypothetical protein|uniref:hypothetical protein n=1 Tax=Rhodoferax sp. TaxID=50421 RepID=UPI001B4BAF91|nr:hypothetical protein [Rhodoferax sp.]MBP9735923.1 hypothetical protein [Rhodoferax sp.]MBP9906266.1 hypothetical protein [Rhodoferax sp.]